jgi:hypothetical protein
VSGYPVGKTLQALARDKTGPRPPRRVPIVIEVVNGAVIVHAPWIAGRISRKLDVLSGLSVEELIRGTVPVGNASSAGRNERPLPVPNPKDLLPSPRVYTKAHASGRSGKSVLTHVAWAARVRVHHRHHGTVLRHHNLVPDVVRSCATDLCVPEFPPVHVVVAEDVPGPQPIRTVAGSLLDDRNIPFGLRGDH